MAIEQLKGVEGVLNPVSVPDDRLLPKTRDFVPQGERVKSHLDHYFAQDKLLNDEFVSKFVKPKILYPNLMTPANFRQVLSIMVALLDEKAKLEVQHGHNPKLKNRIRRAHQVLEGMQDNMNVLTHYLQALLQA